MSSITTYHNFVNSVQPEASPTAPPRPSATRGLATALRIASPCFSRRDEMRSRLESGETLQSIANCYGISRQRVHQITREKPVKPPRPPYQSPRIKTDEYCLKKWGHSLAAHKVLIAVGKEMKKQGYNRERFPVAAYIRHKRRAKQRGIAWEFSLASWWKMWSESGQWFSRGSGNNGYVMGRFGDVGPYSPTNCYIATSTENIQHYFDHRRGDMNEFSTPRQTETNTLYTEHNPTL